MRNIRLILFLLTLSILGGVSSSWATVNSSIYTKLSFGVEIQPDGIHSWNAKYLIPNFTLINNGLFSHQEAIDKIVDDANNFIGSSGISKLGTVTTGTWQGTAIGSAYVGPMGESKVNGLTNDLNSKLPNTYIGSTGISKLGTVTTGTWQATPITGTYLTSAIPIVWYGWHQFSTITSGNAVEAIFNSAQPYVTYYQQNASALQDTFTNTFPLKAGTYTLSVLGVTGSANGEVTWYLDGVAQVANQDWYSASNVYNVTKTVAITATYSGSHTLKGVVATKNAASAGYALPLTNFSIK